MSLVTPPARLGLAPAFLLADHGAQPGPPAVQLGRYDPLRMWTASNQLAVDWKRAHPGALLLSLDDVVADDRRAFDLIGMSELTYQPLASTYDVELLRRGAQDLADPLETELARLSDR